MMEEHYSKPGLVVEHAPLWDHRIAFLHSFEIVAREPTEKLRNEVYPLYIKAREGFMDSEGVVITEHERDGVLMSVTSALGTPFEDYGQLSRVGVPGGHPEAKLQERLELYRALTGWAEEYHLSPQYWERSGNWFLDRVVAALEAWYYGSVAISKFSLVSGMGYSTAPATASFSVNISIPVKWHLDKENKRTFKERVKKEAEKKAGQEVDRFYAAILEEAEKRGFTKPEARQDYERDMGWLIAFQCFGKPYEDLAYDPSSPDQDIKPPTISKAITRRALDIALVLRTKT